MEFVRGPVAWLCSWFAILSTIYFYVGRAVVSASSWCYCETDFVLLAREYFWVEWYCHHLFFLVNFISSLNLID